MLTPTEATRRIVDAATAKTDYTAALDRKLVLPFFRTYRIQPIVAAWMEFAVPELIRQKTASEADELTHMLKPVHLEGTEEKKYQEDTRMTKRSALYATADVFLTAFSLMHPIMLRFEELTVEDKGSETSRQKRLYEESAAFYRLCKAMNLVDDLVNPVLEGRYTFGYRESLESASALKERADDMLESLLRMRHNIENYEVRKEEVEEQFRFSVAARVSAAIVVLEMMQKNADWMTALSQDIVKEMGQYKRVYKRSKEGLCAVKRFGDEPVEEETAQSLIDDLFFTAEKATEPEIRSAAFFAGPSK